jgi:hypothetical protein
MFFELEPREADAVLGILQNAPWNLVQIPIQKIMRQANDSVFQRRHQEAAAQPESPPEK